MKRNEYASVVARLEALVAFGWGCTKANRPHVARAPARQLIVTGSPLADMEQ
ncbi:MAG TPA: hypothetical protein VGH22_10305 [Candidatus Binatia bacterium]